MAFRLKKNSRHTRHLPLVTVHNICFLLLNSAYGSDVNSKWCNERNTVTVTEIRSAIEEDSKASLLFILH